MKRIKCKVCGKKNSEKKKICPRCSTILDNDLRRLIDSYSYGDCKNVDKVSEMRKEIERQIKYGEFERHTLIRDLVKEKIRYEKDN